MIATNIFLPKPMPVDLFDSLQWQNIAKATSSSREETRERGESSFYVVYMHDA